MQNNIMEGGMGPYDTFCGIIFKPNNSMKQFNLIKEKFNKTEIVLLNEQQLMGCYGIKHKGLSINNKAINNCIRGRLIYSSGTIDS